MAENVLCSIVCNVEYALCKIHLLWKILAPYEEGFCGAGEWLCGGLVVCRSVPGDGCKACIPADRPSDSAVGVGVREVGLPW